MPRNNEPSGSHPNQFKGLFEHLSRSYAPLIEEARRELRALPVPDAIRQNYEFIIDRPQPAFILLPLMYLSLADHLGGITARHRRYLPWQMLAMEIMAVYDDTIDHTPLRSGLPTYQARYGPASAAAFGGFLYSVLVETTAVDAPELLPLLTETFGTLCSLEVWEHQSRYPDISIPSFGAWIRRRNTMAIQVYSYSLDSALLLHGAERLPWEAVVRLGDVGQDVDDLVNIVEEREKNGENDDLKMGIPTYPLLATLEAEPAARVLIEEVWRAHKDDQARSTYHALVDLILRRGVKPTIDKMITDAEVSVAATPPHLRPCMVAFNYGFMNRLRHLDPRLRFEARASLPRPDGRWRAETEEAHLEVVDTGR
ncbi:MAG TPA: polyprenyl synthetase family protein [Thermoanaerobaculia bacterium]